MEDVARTTAPEGFTFEWAGQAFEEDRSPDAWEKVVDRLLADRGYGEKWGRHWLDVVRYAETNGVELVSWRDV